MFEKLKEIFESELGCDPQALTPQARLREDLEVDSLDLVGIVVAIEDEYGIELPDEAMQKMVTLQDVVDYFEQNT